MFGRSRKSNRSPPQEGLQQEEHYMMGPFETTCAYKYRSMIFGVCTRKTTGFCIIGSVENMQVKQVRYPVTRSEFLARCSFSNRADFATAEPSWGGVLLHSLRLPYGCITLAPTAIYTGSSNQQRFFGGWDTYSSSLRCPSRHNRQGRSICGICALGGRGAGISIVPALMS